MTPFYPGGTPDQVSSYTTRWDATPTLATRTPERVVYSIAKRRGPG
jgi:hypothetical protein